MLVRTGRPPLDNPRDYRITVRVNKDDKRMLESVCEITGKGKNEVIRTAIKKYFEQLTK